MFYCKYEICKKIRTDKKRHDLIATRRTDINFTGHVDPRIYRHLSKDKERYFYYNNKRVSTGRRRDVCLLSVKSLQKNLDTRKFLRLAGYEQAPDQELERKVQAVNSQLVKSIKSKIKSFKITEDWAKTKRKKLFENCKIQSTKPKNKN